MNTSTPTRRLDGTFIAVRVRYHGPTNYRPSRYIATMVTGDETYRATRSFDYGMTPTEQVAAVAAEAVAKQDAAIADRAPELAELVASNAADRVAIVGDLNSTDYVVTFAPANMLMTEA